MADLCSGCGDPILGEVVRVKVHRDAPLATWHPFCRQADLRKQEERRKQYGHK